MGLEIPGGANAPLAPPVTQALIWISLQPRWYVSIIDLPFRWTDVVEYCKQGVKFCVQNKTEDDLFPFYEKIIGALVENKKYKEALEFFQKIKKFNLKAMDADDVDTKVVLSPHSN